MSLSFIIDYFSFSSLAVEVLFFLYFNSQFCCNPGREAYRSVDFLILEVLQLDVFVLALFPFLFVREMVSGLFATTRSAIAALNHQKDN